MKLIELPQPRIWVQGTTAQQPSSPQAIESEELGEIGARYTVCVWLGRETTRLEMSAASLNPELLRAFKAAQRSTRCKVRGLRRSSRLRGSTTRR